VLHAVLACNMAESRTQQKPKIKERKTRVLASDYGSTFHLSVISVISICRLVFRGKGKRLEIL
jgi:hypothetical protein